MRAPATSPLTQEALIQHKGMIRGIARALVFDPDAAEDVVQETWLAALQSPPRSSEALFSWLASATRNVARKVRRTEARRGARERRVARPEATEPVDEIVSRVALHRELVDELLSLPDPYRSTLLLRYFEDLTPLQISRREDVSVNTIKSRLRRGLGQLRSRLIKRHGGDTMACFSVLLSLAGIAKSAVAGLSGGSTMMSGVLGFKTLATAGILACSFVGVMWLQSGSDGEPFRGEEGEAKQDRRERRVVMRSEALEGGETVTAGYLEEEPELEDSTELIEEVDPSGEVNHEPGLLVLKAVDASTGEPVSLVSAHIMNETRYGEQGGSGWLKISLSPGSFQLSLSSRGFEPKLIDPIVIESGQTSELGVVMLQPGSATLEGSVRGPNLGSEDRVTVELLGAGRYPCPDCHVDSDGKARGSLVAGTAGPSSSGALSGLASPSGFSRSQPCKECGFAARSSVLSVGSGEAFAFRHLAEGSYALRVFDEEDHRVGIEREIEVEQGVAKWMDLQLPPVRRLQLDLVLEDGSPLLCQNGPVETCKVSFLFARRKVTVANAVLKPTRKPAVIHRVSGRRLRALEELGYVVDIDALEEMGYVIEEVETSDRVDRPRESDDRLWPEWAPPSRSPVRLDVKPLANGLVLIGPLLGQDYTLRVSAGVFHSDRCEIKLSAGEGGPVQISLQEERQALDTPEIGRLKSLGYVK